MKKLTELAIILVLLGISSWAQEVRHELTIQGSGFFQKQTTHGGITNGPTNSGGVMAGYRFNLKNWLAVEGDYDYFRNHESFQSISGRTFIPMNVHAATGVAIVKLPSFKMPAVKIVSPFVLAGGGAMFFDPRGGSVNRSRPEVPSFMAAGWMCRCQNISSCARSIVVLSTKPLTSR